MLALGERAGQQALNGGGGHGRKAAASTERRRRQQKYQSPLTRSIQAGVRRARMAARAGEWMYQGRTHQQRKGQASPSQQAQRRPQPTSGGVPLWADELRRRSREGAAELRRRSREGGERARVRAGAVIKRLSQSGQPSGTDAKGTDDQLRQMSEESRSRRSKSGRTDEQTQHRGSSCHSVGCGTESELQRLRDEAMARQNRAKNGRKKMERQLSKSMGVIGGDLKNKGRRQRRISHDENSTRNLFQNTARMMPKRNSFDISSMSLRTKGLALDSDSEGEEEEEEEEEEKIITHRMPPRRSSLDASFKFLGEKEKNELIPHGRYLRQRSRSAGEAELRARSNSNGEENPLHKQRRSLNYGSEGTKDPADEDDELLRLLEKWKQTDQRQTRTGATASDGIRVGGKDDDKRSETRADGFRTNIRRADMRSSKPTHDRIHQQKSSQESGKSAARKKLQSISFRIKGSQNIGSQKRTNPGAALDDSFPTPNPRYDEEDQSEETEPEAGTRTRKLRSIAPGYIFCMMCLCYVVSMIQFCALGFWLHMTFFVSNDDEDGNSLIVSSPSNGQGSTSSNDTVLLPEINPGISPGIGPSRHSHPYSDTAGLPGNGTNNFAVTKQVPSTLSPSYLPLDPPSLSPTMTAAPTIGLSTYPSEPPSWSLSALPSVLPTTTFPPTASPSIMPSSSPTGSPGCPDELLKSIILDTSLTLWYDVIVFQGDTHGGMGGLLCVSLEYTGGPAAWIGLAFSEAARDPQFGRKEAIIGMPGVRTSVAVEVYEGGASVGQQHAGLGGGPGFANPGKYNIPAGGVPEGNGGGYYGPSLMSLSPVERQTLINGTVSSVNSYLDPSDAVSGFMSTKVSFAKYLQEPGEIQIDPHGSTLILHAVAAIPVGSNDEYDGNPKWKDRRITFLENPSDATKSGLVRMRERQHHMPA